MKTIALAFLSLALLVSACASQPNAAPASGATAGAPPPAPEDQGCRRSIPGPGKRGEGEDCGGSTNVSCAEGLYCKPKFRCPGSIGTCVKQ